MSPPMKTVYETEEKQKMGKLGTKKYPHPRMSPTKYDETYIPLRADRPLKQVLTLETVYEEDYDDSMKHPYYEMGPDEPYDPLRANSIIRIQPSVMANQRQWTGTTSTLETIEEEDEIEIGDIVVIYKSTATTTNLNGH